MPKHWREFHDKSVVHCEGADGNDYTLCGDALEGVNGDEPMEATWRDPIRCGRCAQIIAFAKKIKSKEVHPDFRK